MILPGGMGFRHLSTQRRAIPSAPVSANSSPVCIAATRGIGSAALQGYQRSCYAFCESLKRTRNIRSNIARFQMPILAISAILAIP